MQRMMMMALGTTALALASGTVAAQAAWQPQKPIEFVATAGPGGWSRVLVDGADVEMRLVFIDHFFFKSLAKRPLPFVAV